MRSSGDSRPAFDDEARRPPRYPRDMEEKLFTEAEQETFEAEMAAAGIKVVTPKPRMGTITLPKRRRPS
jgi:hypothetical protein